MLRRTRGCLPLPDGLAVAIQQGRLDVVWGRLVVRFENTGEAPVTIDGFTVETPTLAPGLERTKPFELMPDDAIAIRLDLPASICDAEPGPVVVDLTFATAAGHGEGRLTADDPFDTVARVNAADCLGESVAEVAAIRDARAPPLHGHGCGAASVHRCRDRARGIR